MQTVIAIIFELLLILGGILATSALIVAQKPDAARYLERLSPYQVLIGALLLILGIVFFLVIGPVDAFRAIKADALPAVANLGGILVAIILGFLFALPQIVGLAPNSQQRAQELAAKLLPFQLLIGLLAAACGVIGLLYTLGVMKYAKAIGL
jgi:uncharacterized membrane protein YjfL (UPF0719 family)